MHIFLSAVITHSPVGVFIIETPASSGELLCSFVLVVMFLLYWLVFKVVVCDGFTLECFEMQRKEVRRSF